MKSFKEMHEEASDARKDRRLERGGVAGNVDYKRAPKNNTNKFGTGKTALQKELEKKHGKGASALDIVKAEIRKKHGKGAIKEEEQLDEIAPVVAAAGKVLLKGAAKGAARAAAGAVASKAKEKMQRKQQTESVEFTTDILAEMTDLEVSLLNGLMIEQIVTEVFLEEMEAGRDIDVITEQLCESVDHSLTLLTEVSDSYYDSAVKSSKEASKKPEVKAANRRAKLEKIKSTAKKVGSALKSGAAKAGSALKSGAKKAGKAAAYGAGRAVGTAQRVAKTAKSEYQRGKERGLSGGSSSSSSSSGSSSSSSSSSTSSSSGSSSDSSSSSSSAPAKKKPGLLSRIGSKLKSGIKRAVGAGARAVSRGARNVARKLGEETVDLKKINDRIAKQGIQYPTGKKQKTSVALRKEKEAMKEATYPSDFKKGSPVATKKKGGPNAQGPESGRKEINERGDFWHPDPEKDRKLGGPGANQRAREDRAAASKPKSDPKKLRQGESYMDYAKRQKKTKYSPELQKRLDAAKAKKKEGLGGQIMRKMRGK